MPSTSARGAKYLSPRSRENWLIWTCPHACCIDKGVRFTVKGVGAGSGTDTVGDALACVPPVCPVEQLLNSTAAHTTRQAFQCFIGASCGTRARGNVLGCPPFRW